MFNVLGLSKVENTDPQKYTLILKDTENNDKGYFGRTEIGTEETLRAMLSQGGMKETEIDVFFAKAA